MSQNLARVFSAELEGIAAQAIEVEVDLHAGLHAFNIVGLADKALNEAKERVNSALKNCGAKPPNRENRKITVNLAPADIKKTGSQYDLAIALGYLLATGQIQSFSGDDKIFVGELALDGRLRPINGALNIAEMAARRGSKFLFLPKANANEAAVVSSLIVVPIETLSEAIAILEQRVDLPRENFSAPASVPGTFPDLAEIKGQAHAKRALLIAAAGGHNLLMIGPPGVGKSLLSQAMTGILPPLTVTEGIEVTKVYSAAGLNSGGALILDRPFRAPHQTASAVAIVGGGSDPKPGEISLAHRGVLFLDELPEFPKNVLESLRQPLESGLVRVARAKGTLTFPAKFTLVAAMNPCPCGYYGDTEKECRCSAYEVLRYQRKVSGPLLDRIDLQIRVARVALEELRRKNNFSETETARADIRAARERQTARFEKLCLPHRTNSEMSSAEVQKFAELDSDAEQFLETLAGAKLSPRSFYRLLKTGRTIADLAGKARVSGGHLAEAYSYRLPDLV